MNHDNYNHFDMSQSVSSGGGGGGGAQQGAPQNYGNPSAMQPTQPLPLTQQTAPRNQQPTQSQHPMQPQTQQFNQLNHYEYSQQHLQVEANPQQHAQTSVPQNYTEPLPRPPVLPNHQQQHQVPYNQQHQYSQPHLLAQELPAQQSQHQNQNQLQSQTQNQPSSQQIQYGQHPSSQQTQYQNQPARPLQYEQLSSQQMQHQNQALSHQANYENESSSTHAQYQDQHSYENPQPRQDTHERSPSLNNQQPPQLLMHQKQTLQHQSQNYQQQTFPPQQHSQQLYPQHHAQQSRQQPTQQMYGIQNTIPSRPSTYQGLSAQPTLPNASIVTSAIAAPPKLKGNAKQKQPLKKIVNVPINSEKRTPTQEYILLMRRFKQFLVTISKTVDKCWPELEQHVRNTKNYASEYSSIQKCSTTLMGYHKFGTNLINTRKAKIVEQKANIEHIKTPEEIQHVYKIVFAEIYLLKQGCEKGVKSYDHVLHLLSNEKLQLELKKMQFLYRNSAGFEKKMHETKDSLQKLIKDQNLGVVPNRENVTVKGEKQNPLGSTGGGKQGVGKVNIGKRKKNGTTSKKKDASKPKSKECEGGEQDLVVQGGTSEEIGKISSGHGPIAAILDEFPDRLVNPLLELPQPFVVSERVLPVSEYLKMMEIYFPEPDTFPLAYSAKLLGIHLPDSNDTNKGKKRAKNDPWMQIPQLGKYGTLDGIDIDGSQRENIFDYVDPIWSSILNVYRGYRDEYLKQASEMNKPFYFSEDCISIAKDLGILGERITFKVATLDDVPNLCALAEINNVRSESNWFEQIIKSGNHFIISAIAPANEMIGYVHYQFCWFRPQCQNPIANEDVALERVLHIESIRLKDTISFEGSECLVLLALVLEHARRHVVYGMMELPSVAVPILKQYFRMSVISTLSTENALLACDLEKCSFKYAFHTLKDEKKVAKNETQVESYRLLVQLPTSRRVPVQKTQILPPTVFTSDVAKHKTAVAPGTMNGPLALNGTTQDTPINEGQALIKQAPTCQLFSCGNRNQKDKNKSIVVSISKDGVSLVKVPIDRSPRKNAQLKKFEKVPNQENWNTISLFKHTSKVEVSSLGAPNTDAVVTSLKNLQGQLVALETRNRPVLEKLFADVRDERVAFEIGDERKRRKDGIEMFARYEAELLRRIEAEKLMEAKLEEDDNAVCDICGDGESSGENRIIFCDSCDVSVHQHCYGVESVPRGDYFCRACIHHKKDQQKPSEPDALEGAILKSSPIKCELCPKKHGAFVQTQTFSKNKKPPESKWVHFLCAKWQGLSIVEGIYVGGDAVFMVEDVQPIKDHFRLIETRCYLCKGMRGAYNQCRHEGCERYIHITCARSSGVCEVVHGDDHIGPVDSPNIWTLCCPEHSTFSEDHTPPSNKVPREELVALAKTFPVEAKPLPAPEPPKPFYKMGGKERKQKLKDPEYEEEFLGHLMRSNPGIRCEVCDLTNATGQLMKCETCSSVAHETCCSHNPWKVVKGKDSSKYLCISCVHNEDHEAEEMSGATECHMCFTKHGTTVPCSARPMSMKRWKSNIQQFEKSLFGKKIWCHPVCGMWHPKTSFDEDGVINCTNIIMANGQHHIEGSHFCGLCGYKEKLKVQCKFPFLGYKKQCPERFHATCARQAGLEVSNDNPKVEMALMCFNHSRCDFAFRALLEDMIEFEKIRAGNDLSKSGGSMRLDCAANIFNSGIRVLRCLGWAWQWSKWWVDHGDNWEPLLEEGQNEAGMTKEQLKIVESTPTSRRDDARKCRLAAFGAALRNRDYDKESGDDRLPLCNALRAIFSTSSLVGPLSKAEIHFFVDWLGRVYRSKSPLLALGDDKASVNEKKQIRSPVYFSDHSPKFELGVRTLPGKDVRNGYDFESSVQEVDDYFENESSIPPIIPYPRSQGNLAQVFVPSKSKKSKSKKSIGISESMSLTSKSSSTSSKKSKSGKAPKTQKIPKEAVIMVTAVPQKSKPERKKPGRKRKGVDTLTVKVEAVSIPEIIRPGRKKGKPRRDDTIVPVVAVKVEAVLIPERVKPGRKKGKPKKDDAIVFPVVEKMNDNNSRSRSGRKRRRTSIDDCEHLSPTAATLMGNGHESKGRRGRLSIEDGIISNSIKTIETKGLDSQKSGERKERPSVVDDKIPRKSRPSLDDPIPKKNRLEEPIPKKKRGRPKKCLDL